MGERRTISTRARWWWRRSEAWIVPPLVVLLLGGGLVAGQSRPLSGQRPSDAEGAPRFANPVDVVHRSPDPGVLRTHSAYFVYSTDLSGDAGIFPIRRSTDLRTWADVGYIFPDGAPRPGWWNPKPEDPCNARDSGRPRYWGPEVFKAGSRYVAYYSATGPGNFFSIGAATATSPVGPWTDIGRPLVENPELSLIDPAFFEDPVTDKSYLLWKDNTNALCPGRMPTHIVIQEVSGDGLRRVGTPVRILTNDVPWEGAVVEAPTMIHRHGYYYLFYSANTFDVEQYGIGVARSTSPRGPFVKFSANPILRSDETFDGPGGQDVVQD
ncbi:MAG: glycoside hydrolase family 43 protein, partial [Actinobacteria bacterium]|nr:glycoside hydrolase family 43 protein [Actinomycetota bacterium]